MELQQRLEASEDVEQALLQLKDVIHACEGLVGYPFETTAQILTEMGILLVDSPAYGELFSALVEATSIRRGELHAARMLYKRGRMLLLADRPYAAIRSLGLSLLRRLYKHESRKDAVHALYICGCAYERAGLLWAARGSLLNAASLASQDFATYGEVTTVQIWCYQRLKWIELQLGRLPHALSCFELDQATKAVLTSKGIDVKDLEVNADQFDFAMAMLLLKTDFWELRQLRSCRTFLPLWDSNVHP